MRRIEVRISVAGWVGLICVRCRVEWVWNCVVKDVCGCRGESWCIYII